MKSKILKTLLFLISVITISIALSNHSAAEEPSNETKIIVDMKKIEAFDSASSGYFNVPEEELENLEITGYVSQDGINKRTFALKYNQPIDLYKMFPEIFKKSYEGRTFDIELEDRKIEYCAGVSNTNGNEEPFMSNTISFKYTPGVQYEASFYPVPCKPIEGANIVVNNKNEDGDLYPTTSERIKQSNLYDLGIRIKNHTTEQIGGPGLKTNDTIDLVKEYPKLFRVGDICEISISINNPIIAVDDVEVTGDILGTAKTENEYIITVKMTEDTNVGINIKNRIVVGTIRYTMQYEEEDPEGITHRPDHYDIRLVLGEGVFTNAISYYRLLEDNDGNLKYVWVDTIKVPQGESMPKTPEGLVTLVQINNNKTTEIIAPCGLGVIWNLSGLSDFMPGSNNGAFYNSGTTYRIPLEWDLKYKSEYDVKIFNKTDVEGNPVDASFEVSYDDYNHDEMHSKKTNTERRKFVFNHYDSKVIKGKTYENVYEVAGSTTMDDESSETIINTKDGKFTLYYPLYYAGYNYYYDYQDASTYEIDKLFFNAGRVLEKIHITEKTSGKNYIVKNDNLEIEIAKGVYWDLELLDTELNKTIVNKKKPTITKLLDEGVEYDGEFTFNIYEKETNDLVATVKAKANEEVALEPLTTDENGNTTGYLVDGKTYIIKEEPVENFENDAIEGKHGEVKEDGDSKYFEFTFDGSLETIQDVTFHNVYTKVQEELPAEKPIEKPIEKPAEEVKDEPVAEEKIEKAVSIKTGDMIIISIAVIAIAVIGLAIVIIKKQHDNKEEK